MNRRNFLKLSTLGAVAIPTIGFQLKQEKDWITIFDSEELRRYGVRGAYYSANSIDHCGNFGNEPNYNESKNEPFVVKCHVAKSYPRIWSTDHNDVYEFLERRMECERRGLIDEIKRNMAYTSCVQYVRCPCLCGDEKCPTHFTPMIRGLLKTSYNNYF